MREPSDHVDLLWKLSDEEIVLMLRQDPSFELPRLCAQSQARMRRARELLAGRASPYSLSLTEQQRAMQMELSSGPLRRIDLESRCA